MLFISMICLQCNDLDYLTSERKRKIRVLSLFDGIGTGKNMGESFQD